MEQKKIICTKWIGRFGNQCFSYLYGKHVSRKFSTRFYIPSAWDGAVLFDDPAPIVPDSFPTEDEFAPQDDQRTLKDSFLKNKQLLKRYNVANGDSIEFIDPNKIESYGKQNVAYSSLVTDCSWLYEAITLLELKSYFRFSQAIKKTDVFKELSSLKGSYDIAHFRRTDISAPHYAGGHSIISVESYWKAFEQFGVDRDSVIWVSDEDSIGWKWGGASPVVNGVEVPWLPDFLKLVFARKIFRANSAFSQWAAWLGDAEVFSPVLTEYSPGKEIHTEFARGNHPHWMGVKGAHACYEFRLKGDVAIESVENVTVGKIEVDDLKASEADTEKTPRILMLHWNGRFGNRMFSYLFGRNFAEKFGYQFVIPSEWEGSILFEEQKHVIIEDDELRLHLNQTAPEMDNLDFRMNAIHKFCVRTGERFEFFNPNNHNLRTPTNVCFDSLCVGNSEIFSNYSRTSILKWFSWSEEVRNLDLYKRLEDAQGTYDIAHLRRGDISDPNYNKTNPQAYSVVSKESYLRAFRKFEFDPELVVWSSDDFTGKWIAKENLASFGGWTYPFGSHRVPEVIFDWLPDFLRLYFARTLFRSNSSFSWWAGFLSPCATVFSPVLRERKIYMGESDEIECEFVKGNHPHWLHTADDKKCSEIRIPD